MTISETTPQPERCLPELTLQDLTGRIDDYLLGDKRAEMTTLDDGSVERSMCVDDRLFPHITTTLSSVTSQEGITTYKYTRKEGQGSLLADAGRKSMEWTPLSDEVTIDTIKPHHYDYGHTDKRKVTSADCQLVLSEMSEELGEIQRPVSKRLTGWHRIIGHLIRSSSK